MFGYRLFGFFDIEYLVLGFFYPYFVVIFYEYFLEHDGKHDKTRSLIKRLVFVTCSFGIALLTYFLFFRHVPQIHYSYAVLGLIFLVIPTLLMLFRYPNLLGKFAITILFFSLQTFIYEILALKLNYWSFPAGDGKYLSWVTFFGVSFPIEEFLFYLILFPVAILSWYEFFDDDRK